MEQFELTPRQCALYRLITENTEQGKKTSQKEIYEQIEGYEWNETSHDHCPQIWADINGARGINWHYRITKTIVTDNNEYWVASEDEVEEYLDKLWASLKGRLFRFWAIKQKAKQNGQMELLDREGKVIEEGSKARGWIESFLDHPDFE